MTLKQFAKMLDGREYGCEITPREEVLAEKPGFVVVFGYSDDNAELRGAIDDEIGCFDGDTLKHEKLPGTIEAVWRPKEIDCAWAYKTSIPHEEFRIFDDGELYCVGIVCDINKPKQTNADRIRAMSDRELAAFLAGKFTDHETEKAVQKGELLTATYISGIARTWYAVWMQWLQQPAEVENGV